MAAGVPAKQQGEISMNLALNRRQALVGTGSILAAVAAYSVGINPAYAARDSIVLRSDQDIHNLDPANRTTPIDADVIVTIMQGLVRFKPGTTEWEPEAAEEIKQVGPTEISFRLRKDQMFTGGYGEMTAEDVKFSYERFIKPTAEGKMVDFADDWMALDHVEVTGPYEGKIVLKNPSPAVWVITLCGASGLIMSRKAFEKLGEKGVVTTPIGSGPYMLKEWTQRQQFVLAENPDYAGPHKAQVKTITVKPILEQKTADLAFQTGEIDFTLISPETIPQFKALPGTKVEEIKGIDYVWLGPNVEKKPFDDVRVRQAFRSAIDVDAILVGAYGGLYPRANAILAESLLGYWKDAPVHKRDVDGARKLLEEAGLGGGFKTKLTILAGTVTEATAAIVQANLAEVGIEVEIDTLDDAAYWALGNDNASTALELSLILYPGKFDPSFNMQWFTSSQVGKWNWQRWANKDFDDLLTKAASVDDPGERAKLYIEAQKLMDDSAAIIWITHNIYAFAE
jgi:peptide/nickel transport system substrate-binding protein